MRIHECYKRNNFDLFFCVFNFVIFEANTAKSLRTAEWRKIFKTTGKTQPFPKWKIPQAFVFQPLKVTGKRETALKKVENRQRKEQRLSSEPDNVKDAVKTQ